MKNENQFNAALSKAFKPCRVKAVKVSDRFHLGLPDWMLFRDGRAVAMESKWAKEMKPGALLSHKLSGAQRSSLESFKRSGVPGMILIGFEKEKTMAVGDVAHMDEKGNITGKKLSEHFMMFGMDEAEKLLDWLFAEAPACPCFPKEDG